MIIKNSDALLSHGNVALRRVVLDIIEAELGSRAKFLGKAGFKFGPVVKPPCR